MDRKAKFSNEILNPIWNVEIENIPPTFWEKIRAVFKEFVLPSLLIAIAITLFEFSFLSMARLLLIK